MHLFWVSSYLCGERGSDHSLYLRLILQDWGAGSQFLTRNLSLTSFCPLCLRSLNNCTLPSPPGHFLVPKGNWYLRSPQGKQDGVMRRSLTKEKKSKMRDLAPRESQCKWKQRAGESSAPLDSWLNLTVYCHEDSLDISWKLRPLINKISVFLFDS